MKRSLIHLTALAALAGMVVATAGHADQASGPNSMFERLDRNHDGQVTRDEARDALSARFMRMDTDGNGTVTRPEQKDARMDRHFVRMDRNGDGRVTLAEMEAATMQRVQQRFGKLDRDGDGVVTLTEVQAAKTQRTARRAPMTLQDLDARVMRMFDRADTNNDGTLTPDEANLMRDHGQRN